MKWRVIHREKSFSGEKGGKMHTKAVAEVRRCSRDMLLKMDRKGSTHRNLSSGVGYASRKAPEKASSGSSNFQQAGDLLDLDSPSYYHCILLVYSGLAVCLSESVLRISTHFLNSYIQGLSRVV